MAPAKKSNKLAGSTFVVVYAVLLFFGSQALSALAVQPFLPYVDSETVQMSLYSMVSLLVLILLLQFNRSTKSFKELVGIKKTSLKNYAWIFPVLLGYVAVSIALTTLVTVLFSGFNPEQVQDVGLPERLFGIDKLAAFISLIIFTPILEELLFRGVLFRGLRERMSFWGSAVIVSILFAAAHAQWNVALDTFALSIALCYLVEKSGSIFPSIILHSLKNSFAFVYLFVL